jgi:protein-disulfide isomerase
MAMRRAALAVMLVIATTLAACGGAPMSVGGMSADAQANRPVDKSAAYPSTSSAPTSSSPTNIFEPPSGAPTGGRQVIQDPSVAEIMQTGAIPDMSWGRADAPVTIVQYASLTCPYCKRFHAELFPQLKRAYIDTGKVRYILRDFPIGQASGNATIALRCAPPEKYLDLYGKFLAQQAAWVSQEVRLDAIYAVAKQSGMPRARFDECLKDEKLIDGLKWIKDRGRTLGIIGTPNFFIAGKLVKRVLTWPELRDMIENNLTSPTVAARGAGNG